MENNFCESFSLTRLDSDVTKIHKTKKLNHTNLGHLHHFLKEVSNIGISRYFERTASIECIARSNSFLGKKANQNEKNQNENVEGKRNK